MSYSALIVITIIGWGIGSVFYKLANAQMHPIMVSLIVTLLYCILTPITFFATKFPKDITSSGIVYAILGGVCMAIGSLAYFFALRKGDAGQVTTITALYPTLTLILSMIFLQEQLTLKKSVGIAFAFASFIVLAKK